MYEGTSVAVPEENCRGLRRPPALCPGRGSVWLWLAAPGAVPPLSLCFVSVPDGGDAVCAVLRAPLPGAPRRHHLLCLLLPLLLHGVPGDAGAAGWPLPGVQAHVSQQVRAPQPSPTWLCPPAEARCCPALAAAGWRAEAGSLCPPVAAWCLLLRAPALHEQLQQLPPSMRFRGASRGSFIALGRIPLAPIRRKRLRRGCKRLAALGLRRGGSQRPRPHLVQTLLAAGRLGHLFPAAPFLYNCCHRGSSHC